MNIIAFAIQVLPLAFIGGIALAYVVGMPVYGVCIGVCRTVAMLKGE